MLGPVSGDGVIFGQGCTLSGGRTRAVLVHCLNTFDLNRIVASDCTNVWGDSVDGTTGVSFLAQNSTAVGTVKRIEATRCKARTGVAGYSSNGGDLTIDQVIAKDNEVGVGVIYGGGDGDFTINSAFITGTRVYSDNFIGSEAAETTDGLDVFSMINPSTGGRAKATLIRQLTVLDSDPSVRSSVRMANTNTTYTHTATLTNCLIAGNNPTRELHLDEGASATLTVTLQQVAVKQGKLLNDISSGSFTNTNPFTDTYTIPADGNVAGLDLADGGAAWWTSTGRRSVDARGEALPDVGVSIGAYQVNAFDLRS